MLKIPLEQLAYIVEKAREYDVQTAPVDSNSRSNPSDDSDVAILEATGDNPMRQELAAALDSLDDDQRVEILALMWVGRGDFDREQCRDALVQARETHNAAETDYLIGTPLLSDYLEAGLDVPGYSLDGYQGRLEHATKGPVSMHPIADKGEVAIDFLDQYHSGGIGRDGAFAAPPEDERVLIRLVRAAATIAPRRSIRAISRRQASS